ncbi:MAG TPA: FAD-dependent oxidoreductase [Streptosporangiaceae bacterium]|nr:FAD-dependent oxidoreductase [Streptosporangiaceae bacterium]
MTTVVVGGGPAGLAATYALAGQDVVLLEPDVELGGLCRSFCVADCIFDLGGHAFFTKDAGVDRLISSELGVDCHTQPRNAWVSAYDRFVRYPFQAHLHGLPENVIEDCVNGILDAAEHPSAVPANFEEWVYAKFGAGIAEHFMLPYNRKLWGFPLTEIAPTWTQERIVQPEVQQVLTGARNDRDHRDFPNATVRYPSAGGFIELYRPLIDFAMRFRRRAALCELDLKRHEVITDSGDRLRFDHLISTMPLIELVAASKFVDPALSAASSTLRYNSLALVSLVFDRPPQGPVARFHRIYCADASVPFHKLVLNNNSSPYTASAAGFGVQAEVSYSVAKNLPDEPLAEAVEAAIRNIGAADERASVIACDIRHVKYAYPVQQADTRSIVETIAAFYRAHDVFLAGRFGEWKYINSDGAVRRGLSAADLVRTG